MGTTNSTDDTKPSSNTSNTPVDASKWPDDYDISLYIKDFTVSFDAEYPTTNRLPQTPEEFAYFDYHTGAYKSLGRGFDSELGQKRYAITIKHLEWTGGKV